jgi:hypothetical protein
MAVWLFLFMLFWILHRLYGNWVAWYSPVVQSFAILLSGEALRWSTNGTTLAGFQIFIVCGSVSWFALQSCSMWRTLSCLSFSSIFVQWILHLPVKTRRIVLGWQVCKSVFLHVCGHRRQWIGDSWNNPPLCRDTWSLLWQCKSTFFA